MTERRPLALPLHVQGKRNRASMRKKKRGPGRFFNLETKIFFIIGTLVVITITNMLFRQEISQFLNTAPYVSDIYLPIKAEIMGRTLLGLFYIAFLGSLFFLTVPVEASFFVFMKTEHYPLIILMILVYGATLGQLVNYSFGRLIGQRLLRIVVDKKSHKKYERRIRQLGMALVFIFNALPLPSQILSVVLGSIRYKAGRFIFIVFCGQLVKYTFLMVMFENLSGLL